MAKQKAAELAKQKATELAAQKAAEAERQRQAAQAAEEQARAQAVADAMAEEELNRQLSGVRSAWAGAIKQRVTDKWVKPYTNLQTIHCELEVTLLANGEVMEARIVRSSGDIGIDESVKKALFKSSPLPLPSDMRAFQKEIIFDFRAN